MRNFCLFVIFLVLLPLVYSCAKDDDADDKEPPTVSDVKFNVNDTLRYGLVTQPSTLRVNDSTKVKAEMIDTVVAGKWLAISAAFHDDNRLSSFKVQGVIAYRDEEGNTYLDTIVRSGQNIFGVKDTIVHKNRLILLADSTQKYNKDKKRNVDVRVVEGDYMLDVVCMDVTGKVNTDTTQNYEGTHPIRIVRRKAILDAFGK